MKVMVMVMVVMMMVVVMVVVVMIVVAVVVGGGDCGGHGGFDNGDTVRPRTHSDLIPWANHVNN